MLFIIDTITNEDPQTNEDVISYDYYVCGLNIWEENYTVKAVIANAGLGVRYYDHKLTQIEKGRLLTLLDRLSIPSADSNHPLPNIKDKRLFSIIEDNVNKKGKLDPVSPVIRKSGSVNNLPYKASALSGLF